MMTCVVIERFMKFGKGAYLTANRRKVIAKAIEFLSGYFAPQRLCGEKVWVGLRPTIHDTFNEQ